MPRVNCKEEVRLKGLTPGLCRILTVIQEAADEEADLPTELLVTSIHDGTHGQFSRHYKDEALDLRSHSFSSPKRKADFVISLQARLGPKFWVTLEHPEEQGGPEHFHIQVAKGGTYP